MTTIKKLLFVTCAVAAIVMMTGCATIINGTHEDVTFHTSYHGQLVSGVDCAVQNPYGVFQIRTPATVNVKRDDAFLIVSCAPHGELPGTYSALEWESSGWGYGNILLGGVVGIIVDAGSNGDYEYPESVTVELGQNNYYYWSSGHMKSEPKDGKSAEVDHSDRRDFAKYQKDSVPAIYSQTPEVTSSAHS